MTFASVSEKLFNRINIKFTNWFLDDHRCVEYENLTLPGSTRLSRLKRKGATVQNPYQTISKANS